MTSVVYSPGDLLAIVSPGFALLCEPEGIDADALWSLARAESTILDLIDALGKGRLSSLPNFAYARWDSTSARCVVRGPMRIELLREKGSDCRGAEGVSTWAEFYEPLEGVSRIELRGDAASSGAWLPLTGGAVLAGQVRVQLVPTAEVVPGPPPGSEAPQEVEPATPEVAATSGPMGKPRRAARVETPATVTPAPPPPPPVTTADPTVIEYSAGDSPWPGPGEPEAVSVNVTEPPEASAGEPAEAMPAPAEHVSSLDAGLTLAEGTDNRFDAMWGATIAGRRPEDAAVREPTAEELESLSGPDLGKAGDHDDHTMTPQQFARLKAGRAKSRQMEPIKRAPVARLELSNGKTYLIETSALLGRAPQARNTSSEDLPVLIIVDDPYVSGTHVEFRVHAGELTGTDVSSNGTLLQQPGAQRHEMTKGVATSLMNGSVLHVSDDFSVKVALL
ncbi:MAG: FHA domain-containing protein [Nocardioides sp.]